MLSKSVTKKHVVTMVTWLQNTFCIDIRAKKV